MNMGKSLIQQKRGKGSPRYIAPSHRWKGAPRNKIAFAPAQGKVLEFVDCAGHSAPLVRVQYSDGEECLMIAAEGLKMGDSIQSGAPAINIGNTLPLNEIPEGTMIFNIELQPGDGGKFVRSSGTFAKIVAKNPEGIVVRLPSKKERLFYPNCRATIGLAAGGRRTEKPFLRAGTKYFAMRAKNKLWPKVCGISMNAVDHPFGGSRNKKGKPTIAPKNAPPGRNVGKLHPRRTGRTKR